MIQKDIFNTRPDLENLANKIIYSYIAKGIPFALSDSLETYVNEGYAGNVNVYPVVRKIVDPVIGVKWYIRDTIKDEPIEDLNHDLNRLLKSPNKYQSFNQFVDEALVWQLITGNRYIYWMSPESGLNKGKPAELHLLPASQVEILQGDWLNPVGGYRLLLGDVWKPIPVNQVIHGKKTNIKYSTQGTQLYGMSPLKAALKVMAATNKGYDRLAMNFENGGPDVIITNTEQGAGGQEYTKEQQETIWQAFIKKFRSKSKERFMIKNKPVEVHEIGHSVVDMNVLEFMKLSKYDYCNIYNVPAELLTDGSKTQSANNREFMRMLWNNAVIPELETFKDDMNRITAQYNSVTGESIEICYDLSDIPELQVDYATQSQALANAWWMTPNQRRVAMGLPELEDELMNIVYVPMGLVPLDELTAPTEEQVKAFYDRNRIKY